MPIGANTLALYYNKKVLTAAGVDIAVDQGLDVADRGAGQGQGRRQEGHHLLGDRHRGGQLPVPALVLGLRRATDRARLRRRRVSALSLWTDWLKKGYAPNSVINNTQTTSWQEFATGDYAFAENGTWQLGQRREGRLRLRHHPDPGQRRRHRRRRPTGGEFVTVPVQKDTGRYATTQKLVTCLTSADNLARPPTPRCPTSPRPPPSRTSRSPPNPELKVWVDAVKAAKGRTSDNLGTKYPKISEQLWTARAVRAQRRRSRRRTR